MILVEKEIQERAKAPAMSVGDILCGVEGHTPYGKPVFDCSLRNAWRADLLLTPTVQDVPPEEDGRERAPPELEPVLESVLGELPAGRPRLAAWEAPTTQISQRAPSPQGRGRLTMRHKAAKQTSSSAWKWRGKKGGGGSWPPHQPAARLRILVTGLRPGHPHYEDCFPDDALSLSLTDSLALWTVSSGFCSSLSRQSPSDRSLSVFSESLSEIFERSLFKYQMSHVLGYRMSLGPCQSNPSCATSRSPSPQRFAGFFAMSTSTFIHIYMPISISISISIDICVHIDIDIDIALPAFLLARALVHVVTITTASVYNAKDDPLVLEACTQIE